MAVGSLEPSIGPSVKGNGKRAREYWYCHFIVPYRGVFGKAECELDQCEAGIL